jgi:O-antigen/teichoic acid export membrane protein
VIFLSLLVPVSVLLIVLAPAIINNLLGEKWQGTETLVQYFATAGLIGILGEAVVPLLYGIGRAMHVFLTELVQSLTLILGVWIFIDYMGIEGAAFAWVPTACISLVVILYFLYHSVSQPFSGLRLPVTMIVGVATISGMISSLVVEWIPGIAGLLLAMVVALLFVVVSYVILNNKGIIGFSDVIVHFYPGRRVRKHTV